MSIPPSPDRNRLQKSRRIPSISILYSQPRTGTIRIARKSREIHRTLVHRSADRLRGGITRTRGAQSPTRAAEPAFKAFSLRKSKPPGAVFRRLLVARSVWQRSPQPLPSERESYPVGPASRAGPSGRRCPGPSENHEPYGRFIRTSGSRSAPRDLLHARRIPTKTGTEPGNVLSGNGVSGSYRVRIVSVNSLYSTREGITPC